MTDSDPRRLSRRSFLNRTGGAVAATALGTGASAGLGARAGAIAAPAPSEIESLWGKRQPGIAAPPPAHTYLAAFDVDATRRDELIAMLRAWTNAADELMGGRLVSPVAPPSAPTPAAASNAPSEADAPDAPPPPAPRVDSAEVAGMTPGRLTVTFGFGPGLFVKEGHDRFGLASRRPAALVDLPVFNGDQLIPGRTGGDLCVQACADDPQIAFHAVRQLARLADGVASIRWAQTGFIPNFNGKQTPRNLMGFKDGTSNPDIADARTMDQFIWVGDEGPAWMQGGSYVVVRRIRMALEHWDKVSTAFQEQVIGRRKSTGAPIGAGDEFSPVDLEAVDKDGNTLIPDNSHVRLAVAASNDGARILRRAYSYNDGVNFTSERWPPWRQGIEYDAGLLFVCYQRDPRTGFIRIFERMAKFDMMNQFVTHTGGGLFACPPGVARGEYLGQKLFE